MTTPKDQTNPCPPWQDMRTLCGNICASESTVEKWIAEGILPPARMKGGKRMWKWVEVDEMLTAGTQSLDAQAERIRNASRRAEAH